MTDQEIIDLIVAKADQYGCPRRIALACAKAESNLDELAERWGRWPDISFGLFQQTVRWAKEGDHSASDANIALIRRLYTDPAHACGDAIPRLAANVRKWGDNEVALFAWNRPADPQSAPEGNKANYRRALTWADEYLASIPTTPPTGGHMDQAFADYWRSVRKYALNPDAGIYKHWAQAPFKYGPPVGPERKATDGNIYQAFTNAIIKWTPGGPEVIS